MMVRMGIVNEHPDLFLISWESPPFTPQRPIVATLFSKKSIKAIKIERIQWNALNKFNIKC